MKHRHFFTRKSLLAFILMLLAFSVPNIKLFAAPLNQQSEKALVTVESYKINNDSLHAGDVLDITVTLKNKSTTNSSSNVIVKFTNTNGDVFPIDGELNQIYIGDLGVGESVTKHVLANLAKDLQFENFVFLNVAVSYWDSEYGDGQTETILRIPVDQKDGVEISEVAPGQFYAGQNGKVTVSFRNKVKDDIENLVLRVSDGKRERVVDYPVDVLPVGVTNTIDVYFRFENKGQEEINCELVQIKNGSEITRGEKIVTTVTVAAGSLVTDNFENREYGMKYKLAQLAMILAAVFAIAVLAVMHHKKQKVIR